MLITCGVRLVQGIELPAIGGIVVGFEEKDGVVAAFFEARLNKIADELGIAAMTIDDDDLVEAVAGDLIASCFQQVPDDAFRQGKGAGLVTRFVDLSIKVVREDDCILL